MWFSVCNHFSSFTYLFCSVDLNAADTGVQLKPSTPLQDRKPTAQTGKSGGGGCCN